MCRIQKEPGKAGAGGLAVFPLRPFLPHVQRCLSVGCNSQRLQERCDNHLAVFFLMVPNLQFFFVHQPKSMNSETFTLPQGAPEVVGTCKLDTHGFNTNDLQKK